MKTLIFLVLFFLRSNPTPDLPRFVIDGDTFMYRNSSTSEIIIINETTIH